MTRDEYIVRVRQLIAEGERLQRSPSRSALQLWLQLSDDLLATAWGSMDRYHLAWLTVGKAKDIEALLSSAMQKDAEAGKATFVSHLGLHGAKRPAEALVQDACDALSVYGGAAENLRDAARYVISRDN